MTVSATAPAGVPGGVVTPVLAVAGGLAAYALGTPAPLAPGAARVLSPDVLLGAFDALVLLALAWPGRAGVRSAWLRASLLVSAAVPFHAALAAAAGADSGHAVALASAAVCWGTSGALAAGGRRRRHITLLAFLTFGWPVIAYVLADFLRVDVLASLGASPLVFPVLLARSAPEATASAALVPAVSALLLVLASCGPWRRGRA